MFSLEYIKNRAKFFDKDTIKSGKDRANRYRRWDLWWAYDCIEMYQYFARLDDKVFWWSMVVKTLRYANYYK